MTKTIFRWVGIGILIVSQIALAQPADSTMQLSALIQEALQNNPELESALQGWQAAEAQVPQAGALPDPTLVFNLMNVPINTFSFSQEPMTSKQVGLVQKFPFPGKQGLKENIARENATVAEARYSELRIQLIKALKTTYFDLFFIDKSIETVKKNIEVLKEFVRIAETKYSVGSGLQQDVLRAQVELSKMIDRHINLLKKRDATEAQLNRILNRPAVNPVSATEELVFKPFEYEFDSLKTLANANRPLLKAWQAMIRQSEKKTKLAKKEYWPDFSLGVVYSQRNVLENGSGGIDYLSGLVNVRLPLYFWRKQSKAVEESKFNQVSVQKKYDDVRNQIYSGLDAQLNDVLKNERLINLFESGIIPQASQSLNSAIAGYQTDKVDFLTLLTNQINLFNFELDYYRVLRDHHKGAAEIEALTGVTLKY